MIVNFDKVERLRIRVSSYDFKYERLFNHRRFYYEKPLEESASVDFIFNDTKELDELIYTLCDLRKRLEVERGHFVDYDNVVNESMYNTLTNAIKNNGI